MILGKNKNNVPEIPYFISSFKKNVENIYGKIDNEGYVNDVDFDLSKKLISTIFDLRDKDIDCVELTINDFESDYDKIVVETNSECLDIHKDSILGDSILWNCKCISLTNEVLSSYSLSTLITYILLSCEKDISYELEEPRNKIDNDKKLFLYLKQLFKDDFSIYKNDANKFFNSRHWDIIVESLHSFTNPDSNLWICFRDYLGVGDSGYKIRDMYVQNIYKLLKYKIFPIILPDLSDIKIDNDKFSFYKEKDYDKLEMFYDKDNILFKHNPNIENLRIFMEPRIFMEINYIPNKFSFKFIKESKSTDIFSRYFS